MGKIIVISGKQYSGKDTVAKLLLEQLAGFVRVGIGDAIKITYANSHSLSFNEIEQNKHLYRNDLIKLGNWGREQNEDYWLKNIIDMRENVIVPDIRVRHELDVFKNHKAFAIRVNASYESRSKRAVITNANDPTETELDNYEDWDFIIDNDSDYDNLKTQVQNLVFILRKNYL